MRLVVPSTMLAAVPSPQASSPVTAQVSNQNYTYQASVAGSGSVSATVLIQGSNEPPGNGNWVTLGTITLSGTNSASDGFQSQANWVYIRANLTAISASSTVTVTQGV